MAGASHDDPDEFLTWDDGTDRGYELCCSWPWQVPCHLQYCLAPFANTELVKPVPMADDFALKLPRYQQMPLGAGDLDGARAGALGAAVQAD